MKVNNKDLKQQNKYHQGQKQISDLAQNDEEQQTNILDIHQSIPDRT